MHLDSTTSSCDLLVLGAGWTWSFLKPLLTESHSSISFIATTRDGRDGTLKWSWDSESDDEQQYYALPRAKTVLIVFPIKGAGASKRLLQGYEAVHGSTVRWIQLGSTGIYDGGPTLTASRNAQDDASDEKGVLKHKKPFKWTDRHSPYDVTNARAIAEDELLSLSKNAYVLNLCGLWGGTRDPANWFSRIAPSKEALAAKGSVHFIHGLDVARAIVAVHLHDPSKIASPTTTVNSIDTQPEPLEIGKTKHLLGKRYILTDLRVYDWWDLASAWAATSAVNTAAADAGQWVLELMEEHEVRALPRTPEVIGRALDSREFWREFRLLPVKGRWERARL